MDREEFERLQAFNKTGPRDINLGTGQNPEALLTGMQFGFDVVEVQRVGLQPGDVLMVTVKNDDLSQESVDALRGQLQTVFPGNKVFVFAMGTADEVNIAVVTQEFDKPIQGDVTINGNLTVNGAMVMNDLVTGNMSKTTVGGDNPVASCGPVGYCNDCNCGKKEAAESGVKDE